MAEEASAGDRSSAARLETGGWGLEAEALSRVQKMEFRAKIAKITKG
jgi:hypothetical protein